MNAPIIVTAQLAPADHGWANGLRRTHFPPERNVVPAHITLFHHLPPGVAGELNGLLADMVQTMPPVQARIDRLVSLGRGIALGVECPELLALRATLAERFACLLTPQDAARPRLHITIQNKVTPDKARETLTQLQAGFAPRAITIAALCTWYYRGGPWEPLARHPFRGAARHR